MRKTLKTVEAAFILGVMAISACLCLITPALAEVTAEEAAQLKTTLTPFGAERAGNQDGTIPAWDGGYTKVPEGFDPNKRRPDPFADEKPLFTITAQNMDKYADKLSDANKAMFRKYPQYRMNVYPTHRTAAAPQWVYENTFKNATRGKMNGDIPAGVYGGIPFPIPKSGKQAIWNHILGWTAGAQMSPNALYLVSADGKVSMVSRQSIVYVKRQYYQKGGAPETWNGYYNQPMLIMTGPPVRAGEGVLGWGNIDWSKDVGWNYFPGQRRVRQLPNPCCDSPNPALTGLGVYDEVSVWAGRITRYDWKIVGKKELYIPCNENRLLQPKKDKDVLTGHIVNPEHRRWERHRVWVVEATLRDGERHVCPRVVLYLDEDTWFAVIGERYDADGQLWKVSTASPIVMPEVPCVTNAGPFFIYDIVANTTFASLENEAPFQIKIVEDKELPVSLFTPESLANLGVR